MGDKSPRSRERKKKQNTALRDQKKAAAIAKVTPTPFPAKPLKGGK